LGCLFVVCLFVVVVCDDGMTTMTMTTMMTTTTTHDADWDRGDVVCTVCGTVMEQRTIDPGIEWRNFSESDKDRSRAQQVDEFTDDLVTGVSQNFMGSKLGDTLDNTQMRLSRLQQRQSTSDKMMVNAYERISHFSDYLRLASDIKNRAKVIFRSLDEEKLRKPLRTGKKDALFVALLYLACKQENAPRTFKELSTSTHMAEKDIRKYYRQLLVALPAESTLAATAVSPADLVTRFCSKINLPDIIATIAAEVARKAAPKLEGKGPGSIAAAAIYLALRGLSNSDASVKGWDREIASAAHISVTTIRNTHRDMVPFIDELIASDYAPPPFPPAPEPIGSTIATH
jgi:transcription initiation factor TFIIB